MGSSRVVAEKKDTRPARTPRVAVSARSHPLLQLQRQAGNRAVTRLIEGSAGPSASALLPIQRAGGGGVALAPPPLLSERHRMADAQAAVQQEVGHLPEELGPEKGPDESQAQVASREADAMSKEAPQFVPDDPAIVAWVKAQQAGGGGAQLEQQGALLQELQAGKDAESEAGHEGTFAPELFGEPKAAPPGRMARAGAALRDAGSSIKRGLTTAGGAVKSGLSSLGGSIGRGLSSAGRGIKGLFTRDTGSKAIAGGGAAAATVKQGVVEAAPATFAQPSDLAQSVASGGLELAHAIAALVGMFFSTLKASFDIKSLVSSVRVVQGLKKARAEAKERAQSILGPDEDAEKIVEMIDYAIRQKYQKIIKRAIGAAVALAVVGTSLAILIANPVGAPIAALVLGVAGLSMTVYKLARGAWKWKNDTKGKERLSMAGKLYDQLKRGDPLAVAAVRALHLDPDKVARDPHGYSLIFRKLKSA